MAEREAVYRSRSQRQVSFCSRRASLLLVGHTAVGLIRRARWTPLSGLVMGTFSPPICLPLFANGRSPGLGCLPPLRQVRGRDAVDLALALPE